MAGVSEQWIWQQSPVVAVSGRDDFRSSLSNSIMPDRAAGSPVTSHQFVYIVEKLSCGTFQFCGGVDLILFLYVGYVNAKYYDYDIMKR